MKKTVALIFAFILGAFGTVKYVNNAYDYKGNRRKNRKSKMRRVDPSNYDRK